MLDGHAVCTSAADRDSVIIAVRMGLFRSEDQGKTWQDIRVDRFSPFTYGRDIKVSPQDPSTLHACLSVAASSKDGVKCRCRRACSTSTHWLVASGARVEMSAFRGIADMTRT
jgi:hypothetical protein